MNMEYTDNDVAYCIGLSLGYSLKEQNLAELNADDIVVGMKEIFNGNQPKYSTDEANRMIQAYLQKATEKKYAINKEMGTEFLEENKKRPEVQTTASGLQFEVIQEGTGKKPTTMDKVEVHYHGTLIDGTVFDSSVERGQTTSFGVTQVIRGWTEALQLMSEGSKYRLYIPEDLAYGAHPHPGGVIQPYMALIFDVELIKVL